MSRKPSATAVVLLHLFPAQPKVDSAREAARSMPGFQALRLSVTGGGLQAAAAATFDGLEDLLAWVDSDAYVSMLSDSNSEDTLRKSSDILIVEGYRLPPGTAVFGHDVDAAQTADFVAAERDLVASCANSPGFGAVVLLPPAPEAAIGQWIALVSFRTDEQLAEWLSSDVRAHRLAQLRIYLTKDSETLSVDAPFGSIVRIDHGAPRVTPTWKTAMVVLLVLYPTVMTLSRFLGPVFTDLGAHPWLMTWLTQIVTVTVLSYALTPLATKVFARWLDPVDGAAMRITVLGAVAVGALYAASLWLFASARWLQFWDYR
jgi:antibiotic biosynthesis monooxygenase (ABM) superfamily enzyme